MLVHDWGMRCAQVIGAHAPLSCAWRTTHKRWNHHTCFLSLEPCAHDMNAEYFNLLGSGMNMSLNSWVWVLAKMWKSILVLNEYAQPQHSRVCGCVWWSNHLPYMGILQHIITSIREYSLASIHFSLISDTRTRMSVTATGIREYEYLPLASG